MSKEENDINKKEEENMQAVLKETDTFADFINTNKDKICKIAQANTVKNKNGDVVITKDDTWRNEHEWDLHYERNK